MFVAILQADGGIVPLVIGFLCAHGLARFSMRSVMAEHAVYIYGKVSGEDFGTDAEREAIYELQRQLNSALAARKAGECDGNEFGNGTFKLFLYGPDADKVFAAIVPILKKTTWVQFDYAIKRYGRHGAREERVSL